MGPLRVIPGGDLSQLWAEPWSHGFRAGPDPQRHFLATELQCVRRGALVPHAGDRIPEANPRPPQKPTTLTSLSRPLPHPSRPLQPPAPSRHR